MDTLRCGLGLEKERVVTHSRQNCSGDGTDPIYIMSRPEIGDEGGAEGACGVHGGARERTAEENVERDRQADGQPSPRSAAARIHAGTENHEDEEKCQN